MTEPATPLDIAHAAMEAAPADTQARLRFYDRLAASELFVLLEREAEADEIEPRLFELETGPVVVAFDREARLAEFAGAIVPYAGMSGRTLVGLLSGQGIGIGMNLEVAPSAILLPGEAVDWLARHLDETPEEAEAQPETVEAPHGLPEMVLTALDTRLAAAGDLADLAYLAGVSYADGRRGHLLAFIGAVPGAEPALARSVQEALVFSGVEAGSLDVAFFRATDALAASFARVGLRFDLPKSEAPQAPGSRPGMDPDRPPKLR